MKWRFMFEVVTNPITIPATKTTRNERICTSLCKHVKFFSVVVVVVSSLLLQRAIADSIKSLRQRRKPIYLCEFFFFLEFEFGILERKKKRLNFKGGKFMGEMGIDFEEMGKWDLWEN